MGILLCSLMALMVNSIPDKNRKKETNYQNFIFGLELIMIILTSLFGLFLFGASMDEMGYGMLSN